MVTTARGKKKTYKDRHPGYERCGTVPFCTLGGAEWGVAQPHRVQTEDAEQRQRRKKLTAKHACMSESVWSTVDVYVHASKQKG